MPLLWSDIPEEELTPLERLRRLAGLPPSPPAPAAAAPQQGPPDNAPAPDAPPAPPEPPTPQPQQQDNASEPANRRAAAQAAVAAAMAARAAAQSPVDVAPPAPPPEEEPPSRNAAAAAVARAAAPQPSPLDRLLNGSAADQSPRPWWEGLDLQPPVGAPERLPVMGAPAPPEMTGLLGALAGGVLGSAGGIPGAIAGGMAGLQVGSQLPSLHLPFLNYDANGRATTQEAPPEPLFFPERPDQIGTALGRLGNAIPGAEPIWSAPETAMQAAPLLRGTGVAALDRLAGRDPETGLRYATRGEGPNPAGIAGNADEALARAAAPNAPAAPGLIGKAVRASGADPNQSYEFRYRVVPLDELVASHTDTLAPNPAFPPEFQPRLRERTASREQIVNMANTLNPDALLTDVGTLDRGPMIVGADNVVESGNGRVLALRTARREAPERLAAYEQQLQQRLPEYGIDPAAAAGIRNPVLVRERVTPLDTAGRAQFAGEANQAAVLAMSPLEQARQDAGRIPDAALSGLTVSESQSIDQAMLSAANRPLVQQFIAATPANERAALVGAGGELNQTGLARLKAALFAKTYPGEAGQRLTQTFVESTDPTVGFIRQGMFASLPTMARSEGLARSGERAAELALGDDLAKSVDMLARLKQEGMTAAKYVQQSAMFDRELTPLQEQLMVYLEGIGRSPKAVREFLSEYAQAVEAAPHPAQSAMFADAGPTKGAILDGIIARQGRRQTAGPLFEQLQTEAPRPAPAPVGAELARPASRTGVAPELGAPEPVPPLTAPTAPAAPPRADVTAPPAEPPTAAPAVPAVTPLARLDEALPGEMLLAPDGTRVMVATPDVWPQNSPGRVNLVTEDHQPYFSADADATGYRRVAGATAEPPAAPPPEPAPAPDVLPPAAPDATAPDVAPPGDAAPPPAEPAAGLTFTTAKGSTYEVNPDGTTTRNKAARPDVGHEGQSGPQPASQRTFYVTAEDANRLSLMQATSPHPLAIAELPDRSGRVGIRFLAGPDAGKFIRDTVTPYQDAPKVGLTPVELWNDGKTVHFGNEITEVRGASPAAAPPPAGTPPAEPPPPPTPPDTGGVTPPGPDEPGSVAPSATAANVLGLKPIQAGLSQREQLVNRFKQALGVGTPTEEHATPAMAERSRVQTTINSQAATVAEQGAERVKQAFVTDKQGRIPALADADAGFPNGPTVQDVAARLPAFADKLTPQQQAVMTWLRDTLQPYRQLWDEVGARDLNSRADVMDGGFYLPRGRASVEGADAAMGPSGGSGRRGKAGFEKSATFESQAQGVDAGYGYASLHDALQDYVKGAGERIADQHVANYLKAATDAEGRPLASTMADRVDPQLRDAVTALRAKIAARRNTLIAQTVRERMAGQSADAIDRQVARMQGLAANAQGRYEARLAGANTDTVLAAAQREMDVLEQAAQRADRTEMVSAARADQAQLGPDTPAANARSVALDQQAQSDARLAEQARRRADAAQAKVDDLTAKNRPGAVTQAAQREAAVRQQQANVAETQATASRAKADAYATRADSTRSALGSLNTELDSLKGRWQHAQEVARATPRGMGQVNLVELQGVAFPDALANAANAVLQSEGPTTGRLSILPKTVNAVNNLYRGLGATLDNSALGIQGLLGLASDQKAYGAALKVNAQAWMRGGDRALGSYLVKFDDAATAGNLPTSADWGRAGLHVGGSSSEFTAVPGVGALAQKFQNAPGIRQAERAFGFFGDALRLEWAQDEANSLLRSGRTMADLEASGELERIATAVNGATGWSPGRTGGDLGDLALFAPRFLQSRLETVARGVAGLRPGAPLEQRIARNSLLKLIGGGTLLTVAVNTLRGQDTDFRPFLPDGNGGWRRNTNFLRIRNLAGQDWSVFGSWDSLLGMFMDTATGHPDRALRGISGGSVKLAWDLIAGADSGGQRVRDNPAEFATWLAKSFSPFAWQQEPGIVGNAAAGVQRGDMSKVGDAAIVTGGQMLGLKGSDLTPAERRDALGDDLLRRNAGKTIGAGADAWSVPETGPSGPLKYADLPVGQKRLLQAAFPDLADAVKAAGDQTAQRAASETDPAKVLSNNANALYHDQAAKLETDFAKKLPQLSGKALREEIQGFKHDRYQAAQTTLANPKVQAARTPNTKDPNILDATAEKYWSAPAPDDGTGNPDFNAQQRQRTAILAVAKAQGLDTNYITGTGKGSFRGDRFTDPGVRDAVDGYDRAMEALRSYWNIRSDLAQRPAFADVVKRYDTGTPEDKLKVTKTATWKLFEKQLTAARENFRKQNKTADLLLFKYGYVSVPEDQKKAAGGSSFGLGGGGGGRGISLR